MHHQNVSLQNAPSKRTLLTSLKRSKAGPPQLKRCQKKKYVLMVHFAVIRFGGASGACQFLMLVLRSRPRRPAPEQKQTFPEGQRHTNFCEPRFSTPCEMQFSPREKGKMAFVEGFSLKRPFSLSRVGKNRISQGVENRGSLIGVPLALSEKKKPNPRK